MYFPSDEQYKELGKKFSKTAKEMFKELGYKQEIRKNHSGDIFLIEYKKDKSGWENRVSVYQFWVFTKEIKTSSFNERKSDCYSYKHYPKIIPYKQLQAINEQVEELGWENE